MSQLNTDVMDKHNVEFVYKQDKLWILIKYYLPFLFVI